MISNIKNIIFMYIIYEVKTLIYLFALHKKTMQLVYNMWCQLYFIACNMVLLEKTK